MRKILINKAINMMATHASKLAKEGNIEPKKDEFSVILPLGNHQALIGKGDRTWEGRGMSYTVSDRVFIMKKLEDVSLDVFEENN